MVIFVKKIMLVIAVMVIAATSVFAATASAWGEPPPLTVACVNGEGPDGPIGNTPVPATLYFDGGSVNLSLGLASLLIDSFDGKFFVGIFQETSSVVFLNGALNPDDYLEEGWSGLYTVAEGACSVELAGGGDRNFPMCYGTGANSIFYVNRATAISMWANGAKVPYASTKQVTNYAVGNHRLTCSAGGEKPTGNAVSTGNGGEVYTGSQGLGLLMTNPLDYTWEIS